MPTPPLLHPYTHDHYVVVFYIIMGCDGGSIPMREDMVRVKKTAGPPSTQEKLNDLAIRWSTCSLSAEPLRVPIVADMLGNLFNKEALLAAALSKSLPEAFSHIRSLKRVRVCDA